MENFTNEKSAPTPRAPPAQNNFSDYYEEENTKKPYYKMWSFWIAIFLMIMWLNWYCSWYKPTAMYDRVRYYFITDPCERVSHSTPMCNHSPTSEYSS